MRDFSFWVLKFRTKYDKIGVSIRERGINSTSRFDRKIIQGNITVNINEISTAALAYLGDSVIEVRVRQKLVLDGIGDSGNLNRAALDYVKAGAQAAAIQRILPILSEEEERVFKRGRNSCGKNIPKSSSPAEYRAATGMETLFGYLYLLGREERLCELFEIAYQLKEIQNETEKLQ